MNAILGYTEPFYPKTLLCCSQSPTETALRMFLGRYLLWAILSDFSILLLHVTPISDGMISKLYRKLDKRDLYYVLNIGQVLF